MMPVGQPFTILCQQLARPNHFGRVDLHLHTTASDGNYTPTQLVDLARRSGLAAIAITDHDTCAGIPAAQQAALGSNVEVCTGVEITTEYRNKELHLLGYHFNLDHLPLQDALGELQHDRIGRFQEMVARLHELGVHIPDEEFSRFEPGTTLGRRHLAELVVKVGKASSVRQAFQRYLSDRGRACVPKKRLPVAQAISLVRSAGGVAAWAHPSYDCTRETLIELRDLGLGAVEVDFPSCKQSRHHELRTLATQLELSFSAGSDCHGPGEPNRAPGSCTISHSEYLALTRFAK